MSPLELEKFGFGIMNCASVKEEVKNIELEIAELRVQIDARNKRIGELYSQCQHTWLEPKMICEATKRTHPWCGEGDAYTPHHWERECQVCGKKETTYRENLVPVPDFESNYGKSIISQFKW